MERLADFRPSDAPPLVANPVNTSAFLGTNPQLTLTVATNTEYSSKPRCVRAPVALGVCSSWFDVQTFWKRRDEITSPVGPPHMSCVVAGPLAENLAVMSLSVTM